MANEPATAVSRSRRFLHVVLFPWKEQSHVTPIFALGRALAHRGLLVTCALPAARYSSYQVAHKASSSALFRVECIEETHVNVVNGDIVHNARNATEQGLLRLLLDLEPPPTCLISDLLYPWTQDLADRLSIPRFQFSPYPATSYLVASHIPDLLEKGVLPLQPGMEETVIDYIPGLLKGFRVKDIPMEFLSCPASELMIIASVHNSRKGAGLVINTSYALEAETLNALSAEGLQIYPVGPMFTIDWMSNAIHSDSSLYSEDEESLRWLDGQPRASVVYASFGSIISLTNDDIQELAMGLEACGQPFLWVIRKVEGDVDPKSALPRGFMERNQGRGCIISWAPQTAVLSHPSLGCFLTHCGYGCILEALWTGIPMLGGFYKISDQNTNFKLVTDGWGVAMPLVGEAALAASGNNEGKPTRLSIETGIKGLMHGEKGRAVRRRCMDMKTAMRNAVASGGSSLQSLEKLATVLRQVVEQPIELLSS